MAPSRKLTNWLIDLLVIVVQISANMTIIPYYIYANFEPFRLVPLVNALLTLILLLMRFRGKIYPIKTIFSYYPLKFFLLLIFFQFLSGISKQEVSYILAPIIFAVNFFVLLIYVNNMYEYNIRNSPTSNSAFFKSNSIYTSFALLNVGLVLISVIFYITGVLVPFTNSINHLYPQLLGSNIDFGGAYYYMPGHLSIQLPDSRLGFSWGTLSGLTHEPHVFGYLVFPSLFLLLSKYAKNRLISNFLIVTFAIAGLLSFSVTTFLVISAIFVIKFIGDKAYFKLIVVSTIFFGLSIINFNVEILDSIGKYTYMKISTNTSSIHYTANKIESILYPKTILGDGVMLLGKTTEERNGGFFTSILYILFYISIFVSLFKIIFSNNRQNSLVGLAFLYFILHGFKLSSSVFAMPYTIYFLTLMAIYYKSNLMHSTQRLKH